MEKTPLLQPDFNLFLPSYWLGQVDTRPLSLFRILFALALIKVSLYYLYIAELFFSDAGLIPRAVVLDLERRPRFSLLDYMGEPWQVQLFFMVWVLIGIHLLLGFHTRWMTLLNFIFIVSVHERNTFILNGADTVMRVLSFWMIFIPLGQHYSVDALRRRWRRYRQSGHLADLRVSSEALTGFALPIRLIQIQIALIYLFTFILKIPGEPWKSGAAMHYALQVKSLVLPTGDWMLAHSPYPILQVMTYGAVFTEAVFLLFVFIPLLQPIFRAFALVLGMILHLGIGFLMAIPNFSYVMIASYATLCLPSWVLAWDYLLRAPRTRLYLPEPPENSPLLWALNLTRPDEIEVLDFPNTDQVDTWVVFDPQGASLQGLAAWQAVGAHLPLSRVWLPLLRWRGLRGFLWRAGFLPKGNTSAPRQIQAEWVWLYRGGVAVFLILVMVGVVWWNLHNVRLANRERLVERPPENARVMIQTLGLWQYWNMFAPYPTNRDGWLVIEAEFEDGRILDLISGEAPVATWRRWYWGPHRWKKYTSNLRNDGEEELFQALGAYYCRLYTAEEGERLMRMEILYHFQRSYAPHAQPHPIETRLLWRHWCFGEFAPS